MKNFTEEQEILLTGYALGELDEATRKQVEKDLLTNEAARRYVDEIKNLGNQLTAELQSELGDGLHAEEKKAIEKELTQKKTVHNILRFPSWVRYGSLAAAACVAFVLGAHHFLELPVYKDDASSGKKERMSMTFQDAPLDEKVTELPAITDSVQSQMGADGLPMTATPVPQEKLPDSSTAQHHESVTVDSVMARGDISSLSRWKGKDELKSAPSESKSASGELSKKVAPTVTTAPAAAPAKPSALQKDFRADVILGEDKGTLNADACTGSAAVAKEERKKIYGGKVTLFGSVDGSSPKDRDGYVEYGGKNSRDDRSVGMLQSTVNVHNEGYERIPEKPFSDPRVEPLSTFSIDVDTASYSNVRRFLNDGQVPPPDAVRIEEMVNYFHYNYPQPKGNLPFSVNVEVSQAPWNSSHLLARVGIKGREVENAERPRASLVFLVDVSGSMSDENKLPLVVQSLKLLTQRLRPDDRVAIVTYANGTRVALPSTSLKEREVILASLDKLSAGGGTNGAGGIQLAYEIAKESFIKGGINRVILSTDGDFNVGITDKSELLNLIKAEAKSGVFLNVYGFGMGNYKDDMLSLLSQNGNGIYGYIDSRQEARKIFVDQLTGTLVTIAKDVKIQVEFNPANVASYKLVGYENRMLAARDFNDDKKDAGEIGAGHTITALYEIVLPPGDRPEVDPLKYQPARSDVESKSSKWSLFSNPKELMTVKMRFKKPTEDVSSKIELPVPMGYRKLADASGDFKFAASVAGFGMILRNSEQVKDYTCEDVLKLSEESEDRDIREQRAEFRTLVQKAERGLRRSR